jgi:hypothetical protein
MATNALALKAKVATMENRSPFSQLVLGYAIEKSTPSTITANLAAKRRVAQAA